jgi:hypothetical protein
MINNINHYSFQLIQYYLIKIKSSTYNISKINTDFLFKKNFFYNWIFFQIFQRGDFDTI